MTAAGAIVLLASLLAWVGLLLNLLTLSGNDPAGRGLAEAWALYITVALWLLLGVLLLLASARGHVPGAAKPVALVLWLLSGASAIAALALLTGPGREASRWPLVVLALIPALIMAYALRAWLPGYRQLLSPDAAGMIAGGGVLLLSLLPWPAVLARSSASGAARSRQADSERHDEQAAFDRLTAESPLAEWRRFTDSAHPLRERALEAIRRSPRRQADAEAMLAERYDFPMVELPRLALEASPTLCAHARAFLAHEANFFRSNSAGATPFAVAGARIQRYLEAMDWLVAGRCDLGTELAAIEAALREFPDPGVEHRQFLAAVVRLRGGR